MKARSLTSTYARPSGQAEGQFAQMPEEWIAVLTSSGSDQVVLTDWEQSMDSMQRETASLRDQGLWRGGHRTLMPALGIQHRQRLGLVELPSARGQHNGP